MRNENASVTIEAKTLELALVKASVALGVGQGEIEYDIIKKTGGGLLSFFSAAKIEIKARAKTPSRSTSSEGRGSYGRSESRGGRGSRGGHRSHSNRGDGNRAGAASTTSFNGYDEDEEAAAPSQPLSPEKIEALREELREFCRNVCEMVVGEAVVVRDELEAERLVLEVESDAVRQILARSSKLAEALEHILRKKPRHLRQELPFRIFVDSFGVRKAREAELVQMAQDLSAKVSDTRRPIVLNYKSSYDRKIIHMALDKDARVYTKSVGTGPNRKLMILPARDGSSSDHQERYENIETIDDAADVAEARY